MLPQKQRDHSDWLMQKYTVATHETDYFADLGLKKLVVFEGVMPPEISPTTQLFARFLFDNRALYKNLDVLDMGCGSGILALIMAKYGAKSVIASDLFEIAVKNTKENFKRYAGLNSSLVAKRGDLFENIKESFDLIVFNHPFSSGKPVKKDSISTALFDDGHTIKRFFSAVPKYLKTNGRVMMAFAEKAGKVNDPKVHAEKSGFIARELASFDSESGKRFIYELQVNKAL